MNAFSAHSMPSVVVIHVGHQDYSFWKSSKSFRNMSQEFCTLKNVPFLPLLQLYKQVTAFPFPSYIIFVINITVLRDYTHSSIISVYQTLEKRISLRKSKFMDFFPLK